MQVAKKPLDVPAKLPEVNLIGNPSLRAKVIAVWEDLWERSEWTELEAMSTSPEIPYPHLPHNRAVVAMAIAVADAFERFHGVRVDRDVLIAAGLLQDACKLVETQPKAGGGGEISEIGRAYPHGFYGAHIAIEHGVPTEICHIILNHTPQSPKFPTSLEGKILYYVDQLDVLAIFKDRWHKELMITK